MVKTWNEMKVDYKSAKVGITDQRAHENRKKKQKGDWLVRTIFTVRRSTEGIRPRTEHVAKTRELAEQYRDMIARKRGWIAADSEEAARKIIEERMIETRLYMCVLWVEERVKPTSESQSQ